MPLAIILFLFAARSATPLTIRDFGVEGIVTPPGYRPVRYCGMYLEFGLRPGGGAFLLHSGYSMSLRGAKRRGNLLLFIQLKAGNCRGKAKTAYVGNLVANILKILSL